MTIKLCLLKSGEDIITDITEMRTSDAPDSRVVGYFMDKPCVVKMRNPQAQQSDGNTQKAGFEVSLFPWMPLSAETRICLLYTSPSPRDLSTSRMPSSA